MSQPAERRTRVLHVMATAEIGGGSEHLVHLVTGLAKRGYDSTVVFGRPGPTVERLRGVGADVHIVGVLRFAGPFKLGRAFRSIAHDLLHLHGSRSGFLAALYLRIAGRAPAVYTGHALAFNRRLPSVFMFIAVRGERFIASVACRTICLTRGDLERARKLGVPVARAVVVPNGIPIERFESAGGLRAEFGLPPGTQLVGMLARLVEQKNPLGFVATYTCDD